MLMSKRKLIFGLAALVLITVLVGQSLSSSGVRGGRQPQQGAQQPQRGSRTGARPERGQTTRNYEQMQEMMLERMKTQLKVSDEKWPTVKPLLKKVRTLREQVSPRFGGMMFGRGGMGAMGPGGRGGRGGTAPGGRGGTATDTPQTDIEKATEALRTSLRAEAPKADDIKAKLAALRAAKSKAKKDLAKAESDLKAQLTTEQEANLVLMGQMD